MAEDRFNQHTDYPEYDGNGRIIGFWADYYNSDIMPAPEIPVNDNKTKAEHCEISWSGTKPQLKVGGSYKTFTVNLFDKQNNLMDYIPGNWTYIIDDYEIVEGDVVMLAPESSSTLSENQIKLKIANNSDLLGRILKLQYTADGISGELLVELVGM